MRDIIMARYHHGENDLGRILNECAGFCHDIIAFDTYTKVTQPFLMASLFGVNIGPQSMADRSCIVTTANTPPPTTL